MSLPARWGVLSWRGDSVAYSVRPEFLMVSGSGIAAAGRYASRISVSHAGFYSSFHSGWVFILSEHLLLS